MTEFKIYVAERQNAAATPNLDPSCSLVWDTWSLGLVLRTWPRFEVKPEASNILTKFYRNTRAGNMFRSVSQTSYRKFEAF